MTPAAVLLGIVVGFVLSVAVIRVAIGPLLAEVRALRVDLASGLAGVARRSSVEAPAP